MYSSFKSFFRNFVSKNRKFIFKALNIFHTNHRNMFLKVFFSGIVALFDDWKRYIRTIFESFWAFREFTFLLRDRFVINIRNKELSEMRISLNITCSLFYSMSMHGSIV